MRIVLLTTAAIAGLASVAGAQQRAGGGLRLPPPAPPAIGGFHGGFPVFVVEREVPVIVEKAVPAPPPQAVPLPIASQQGGTEGKRKPYVVGASYASLPGGCMKMIEDGASYYYCGGGEWYQQTGKLYRAVAHKL